MGGQDKSNLCLSVDRIEIKGDEIRIRGSKAALTAAMVQTKKPGTGKVPRFVQEWWARQDSNLRPDRYERPALTS